MSGFTDEQKLILHMCMQATKTGYDTAWISRSDICDGHALPTGAPLRARLRLMWAALAMPTGVLEWSVDGQQFRISAAALKKIYENMKRRIEKRETTEEDSSNA